MEEQQTMNTTNAKDAGGLILDLDGTIIVTKSGNTFPIDKDDWKFKPKFLEAFYNYAMHNDLKIVLILTNQAGVEENFIKPIELKHKLNDVTENIKEYLYLRGASDMHETKLNMYMLPSVSMNCTFRKPKSSLKEFALEGMKLDISNFTMVGDASGLIKRIELDNRDEIDNEFKKAIRDSVNGYRPINISKVNFKYRVYYRDITNEYPTPVFGGEEVYKQEVKRWYKRKEDFSDSDAKCAEHLGINYVDIEEFIKANYKVK